MGYFGGAGVNQALKENRKLLKKRRDRKKPEVIVPHKEWVDHKHATPKQLLEIREKVQKQQRIQLIKITLVILLGVLVIMSLIYFLASS